MTGPRAASLPGQRPARAGRVLKATYGWYWAADPLAAAGAEVHLAHPLEVIASLLAGDRGYQLIQQLPGNGPVLAAVITAEIGDVTRFKTRASCAPGQA